MADLDNGQAAAEAFSNPVSALPSRGHRLALSGDCVQSKADAMATRDALISLCARIEARCLTVSALNLANAGVQLGRDARPEEIGVFGSAITPFAIVSLRTWPLLRHFELDMFTTQIVQAKIITKWARETLGTRAWACEITR